MGETAIDEETFDEYLAEIRDHYTADKVSCYLWWHSAPFADISRPSIIY